MEMTLAELLTRALDSVSVRMADGTRDPSANYCEQCRDSGIHRGELRCDCWCHGARAALAAVAAVSAAPENARTAGRRQRENPRGHSVARD
jgi:hypothetical protein